MPEPIIQDVQVTWSIMLGIKIRAAVGGRRFSLEELQQLASEIGDKPGQSLHVAWPSRGHQDPEAKVLKDVGVLEHEGRVGDGIAATSGPRCGDFYREANDDERWNRIYRKVKEYILAKVGIDTMCWNEEEAGSRGWTIHR